MMHADVTKEGPNFIQFNGLARTGVTSILWPPVGVSEGAIICREADIGLKGRPPVSEANAAIKRPLEVAEDIFGGLVVPLRGVGTVGRKKRNANG